MTILRNVIRFVVAAVVLMFVGFLVPGFSVNNFWTALIAAVVIALLGWVVEAFFGDRISPYNRGIVGFLVSAVVIYLTQFVVTGFYVTILGALLASLVIGIIDLFIPIKTHMDLRNGDAGNRQET
ncbi:phage holin family protein [Brevibacillus borstelensis]|uniref:phage holin family protein n=1 Tax=Brevibacillus borstelensis TaxID=45462 RepID=UPI001D0B242A|nr:phage holin family protein [Brevibacillus borstelensis]MCC0563425.1 phage holin family protein [Brevibacillus borstelensis]MCM3471623.1 phage holin family protein [Brevibacillus borstelensis]MCM3558696.1 phage holin family protein [Brevibacillus borstelensis]MCM3591193.1 phage holin family protein [Brevibacillus borstelensis]MCM3621624.1 phage holin family protein [Brevibacillus borstelensis]